jgi:hypothetical protein
MSGPNEITAIFPHNTDSAALAQHPVSYETFIEKVPVLEPFNFLGSAQSTKRTFFDFITQVGEKALWCMQTQSVPQDTFPSVKPNPYAATVAITIFDVTLQKVFGIDTGDDGETGQGPKSGAGGPRGTKRPRDGNEPGDTSNKRQKDDQSKGGERDQEQNEDANAFPGDNDMSGGPSNTLRHEAGIPDVRQRIPVYSDSLRILPENKTKYSSAGHPGDSGTASDSEIEDEITPNESVIAWVSETLPPFDDPQNLGRATGREWERSTAASEPEQSMLSKEASNGQNKGRGTLRQKRQWRGRSKVHRPAKASKRASRLEMDRAVATAAERLGRPVNIGPGHSAKSLPELVSDTDRRVYSEGPAALKEVRVDPGRNNPL